MRLLCRPANETEALVYNTLPNRAIRMLPLAARRSSGGALGNLPLELLHRILWSVDVHSMSKLRLVNNGIKETVENFPAYRSLVRYCPNVLRALASLRCILVISVAMLYHALTQSRCVACGAYAPFLSLLTCQRACWTCLKVAPSMHVISAATARSCFGVGRQSLKRIPMLFSPAGFSAIGTCRSARLWLVDANMAKELGESMHGGRAGMEAFVQAQLCRDRASYYKKLMKFRAGTRATRPKHVSEPNDLLALWPSNHRAMTFTPMVSLDRRTHVVERGWWCGGCLVGSAGLTLHVLLDELDKNRRTAYTAAEMVRHLANCPATKAQWTRAIQAVVARGASKRTQGRSSPPSHGDPWVNDFGQVRSRLGHRHHGPWS